MEKETNLQEIVERGFLFAPVIQATEDFLQKKKKIRECYQKELVDYLADHPPYFTFTQTLLNLIASDRRYGEMRMFGGCDEVRQWERIGSRAVTNDAKKEVIKNRIPQEEVEKIVRMIFLAMPEYFQESHGSHPQKKLDDYYEGIKKGDNKFFYGYLKDLKVSSSVMHYLDIANQKKFKGWPLVGEPKLGEKIPFFGQTLHYVLETGNGAEDYTSIIRHFGWCVAFGITRVGNVVTLIQWKPGINQASWELPPGGIGKIEPGATQEEILKKTQEIYLRETGYGKGSWEYLGNILIETGKYRGAGPNDHGLPAHMMLATSLERVQDARQPNKNEIMETLEVPLEEFRGVIESGFFKEASALPCAMLALIKIGKLKWK